MPDAQSRALLRDIIAARRWAMRSPGKQRGMTNRIHTAKTELTRERRVAEVIAELVHM